MNNNLDDSNKNLNNDKEVISDFSTGNLNDNDNKKSFFSKLKISRKMQLIIGVWLIIIGIGIVSSNYLMEKKNNAYDAITLALSANETPEEIVTTEPDPDVVEGTDDPTSTYDPSAGDGIFVNQAYYIGRIEIPKINLIKGLAPLGSEYNQVRKNVTIIEGSNYPDVEKGNFILAAHTGNAWNCFFRNLYKLVNDDEAYIYYDGYEYRYKVANIYTQTKTGTVTILRNLNKTTLTLITCTKGSNTKQTIIILNLVSKNKI